MVVSHLIISYLQILLYCTFLLYQDNEPFNEYILKIFVILLAILTAMMSQIFFLAEEDSKEGAIFALTVISMMLLIYITFSFGVIIGTFVLRKKLLKKHTKAEYVTMVVAYVMTALAGLFYLIGNRFGVIFVSYGHVVGCESNCQRLFMESDETCLILAILLFSLTPSYVNKTKVLSDHVITEHEPNGVRRQPIWSPWKVTAQSMAHMLEFDAWFSAVSDIPLGTNISCPSQELYFSWALFGASLTIWAILLIIMVTPGVIKVIKLGNKKYFKKVFILCIIVGLIWISSGGLILADNTQPFGCVFGCHTNLASDNSTNAGCQFVEFHVTRFVILFIIFIYLLSLAVTLTAHWCKKNFYRKKSYQLPHDQAVPSSNKNKEPEMGETGGHNDSRKDIDSNGAESGKEVN